MSDSRSAALLMLLAGASGVVAGASERGLRPLQSWGIEDHGGGSQSWVVVQDEERLIHVGNLGGHLLFDGETWELTTIEQQSAVLALADLGGGRMVAGGFETVGIVEADATGRRRWRPLELPGGAEPGDVYPLHALDGVVWGGSRSGLIAITDVDGTERVEVLADLPPERHAKTLLSAGGELLLWTTAGGLTRVVDRRERPLRFELLASAESFADDRPLAAVRHGSDLVLLLATGGLARVTAGAIQPWAAEASRWLDGRRPTSAVELPDGRLAIGVRRGGILVLAANGAIDELIDGASGLPDDTVLGLTLDRENGLWVALDSGLARIDILSPLTVHDRRVGLTGSPRAVARWRERLYAGTAQGLWRLEQIGAGRRPGWHLVDEAPTWSLLPYGEDLLVGTDEGVRVMRDEQQPALAAAGALRSAVYGLSTWSQPASILAGTRDGLAELVAEQGRWRWELVEGTPSMVRSAVERGGTVWLGTVFDGVVRLDLERDPGGRLALSSWRQVGEGELAVVDVPELGLLAVGEGTVAAVLDDPPRLSSLQGLAAILPRGPALFTAAAAGPRSFWLNTNPAVRVRQGRDGGWQILDNAMPIGTSPAQSLAPEPNGVVWMATDRGLARWEPSTAPRAIEPVAPTIRSVLGDGASLPLGPELELAYGTPRRLRVELTATRFCPGVEYRYRLQPVEADWSAWTREPFREFTALREGRYALDIQSRAPGEDPSPKASLGLAIRPPWHRHPLALVLLVGLTLGLGLVAIRARERGLAERTRELEREVDQRTADLSHTVEELRLATLEVSRKNRALEEANAALKRLSERDGLTAIANRRAFETTLAREWALARRSEVSLAIILADLDDFKRLNDVRGHLAGDECLKRVALLFESALPRESDHVARYGGEEFGFILPATDAPGARRVAERLTATLAAAAIANPGAPGGRITASFGIAATVPGREQPAAELVAAADAALYRAKEDGRDCIRVAEP